MQRESRVVVVDRVYYSQRGGFVKRDFGEGIFWLGFLRSFGVGGGWDEVGGKQFVSQSFVSFFLGLVYQFCLVDFVFRRVGFLDLLGQFVLFQS